MKDTLNALSYFPILRDLVKSSGLYALSSIGAPLVSLVLAPFITHHLSLNDYGILAVLVTLISLGAGVMQLGLGSAFFRTYSFDYTSKSDRRSVLATIYLLLSLASIPLTIAAGAMAPFLASLLLGRSSHGELIILAAVIILLQNLTVPVFAWLRAENRALLFTIVSMSSLLINAAVTIVCIGMLHLGIAGALIGMGSGYACVMICAVPAIVGYVGFRVRIDIARGLLAFGLPLVSTVFSSWVLQLSDRFLLSRLGTLSETASYAVAYNLGSVLSTLVISPFTLAWPTAMYAIAKQSDATRTFRLVFRWFGSLLFFAAFVLSLVATVVLKWFFPASYYAAAPVIPIVAGSIAFEGIYYVFMVGANITRKTWLAAVLTAVAAAVNFALNLFLIPAFGAMGAAASTLVAYMVLALSAYIVNQRIYPIRFEIGFFIIELFVGVTLYVGSSLLALTQKPLISWSISIGSLILYGVFLMVHGGLSAKSLKNAFWYVQEALGRKKTYA